MKTFSITIDMEEDFGGRLNSFRGIHEALPKVLKIFEKYNIFATFFISGPILNKFPEIVKQLDAEGHDVAAHGIEHKKLKYMNEQELENFFNMTRQQFETLNLKPIGFRSPYLMPHKNMPLKKWGFKYDSSLTNAFFPGRYCGLHLPTTPFKKSDYVEFPVSRLPWSVFAFTILQADTPYCLSLYSTLKHTTIFFHLHDLLVWNDINFLHGAIKVAYKNKYERFNLLERIIIKNNDKKFITLKKKAKEIYE